MLKHFIYTFFCMSILILTPITGTIINVPGDQPNIQAGIDAATDGDTVLVAPGTFLENINYLGKRIVVASFYILNHDLSFISSTIIDGSNPSNPDTASCVRFYSGEDSAAILQGFTITGGTGTKWVDPQFPQYTWRGGGGVFTFMSSPTIKNNLIMNNDVTNTSGVNGAQGGGTLSYGGNPQILNNAIMLNEARYGAGIVIDYSGGMIKNNIIYGNTGGQDYGGGGFWSIGNGTAPVIIENNHIVENSVTGSGTYGGRGGAMFVWMGTVTACNNIIWGNTQSQGGPIAQVDGGTALVTYSDVEGGFPGEGNIDLNPAFEDTNFYLSGNSTCIDAGNADPIYNDPEDPNTPGFAHWPSMGGLRNDMGAYGGSCRDIFPPFYLTGISGGNTMPPQHFWLEQNYPNPFNPVTTIRYSLQFTMPLKLAVYDVSGREVATLVDEIKSPGSHRINFDATGLNSGIYFYKLNNGKNALIRKMIILR
jgi:hypothetical protein